MNNVIQQLKDNEKPFGLMSEDMQEQAILLSRHEFKCYMAHGVWLAGGDEIEFVAGCTYRLRPDYEDEPEIEECEILGKDMGCLKYYIEQDDEQDAVEFMLEEAIRHPDFIGFKFEDGKLYPISTVYKFKDKLITYYSIDIDRVDEYTVLHASHVLFRRNKT